ncbi:MAG: hypothetical protein JWP86_3121 [Phenylobacterium sp.]|nr:hypothetical protein [Phenylobacterium sp.]
MRFIPVLGAALILIPAAAAAQPAGTPNTMPSAPPAAATSPPASTDPTVGATTGATAGATVTAGLPVKDKTGLSIGQVTQVKADASGKQVATIRMGADSFAVDTAALAVDNGAATINATQAEIRAMLPKKK